MRLNATVMSALQDQQEKIQAYGEMALYTGLAIGGLCNGCTLVNETMTKEISHGEGPEVDTYFWEEISRTGKSPCDSSGVWRVLGLTREQALLLEKTVKPAQL